MRIFEFGEYWDTNTFILFFIIGIVTAFCFKKGIKKREYEGLVCIQHDDKNSVNPYFVFVFIIYVLFYTLRDKSVGSDTIVYVDNYFLQIKNKFNININEILRFQQSEPLFLLLLYLVNCITDNYTILFLIVGIIVSYGYVRFVTCFWGDNCEFTFLILPFLTAFMYDMNVMRSGLAVSFMLQSLCYLKKNQILKTLLFTLIGFLFHYSMIINFGFIAFFLIWNRRKKVSVWKTIILILISTVVMTAMIYFLRPILNNVNKYSGHFASSPSLWGHWSDIFTTIASIYIIIKRPNMEEDIKIPIATGIFNIYVLLLSFILGAGRITHYYFMPRLLVCGYFIGKITKKDAFNILIRRIIIILIVLFYALYTLSRRSDAEGFKYVFRPLIEMF